jgi:nucleoside-diphosphate-sugar epimerase
MHFNHKPHIIITGAGGFIGSELVSYFHTKTYAVTALVRQFPRVPISGVNYLMYDLSEQPPIACFSKDSILIHCAYHSKATIPDVNISGAQRLIDAARKAGLKKIIFFSSLSAESHSKTYYSHQKQALESLFGFESIILRPGLVIGNGGLFSRTVSFIKRFGLLPILGKGRQAVYYIGIKDLLSITEWLIKNHVSGAFHAFHPQSISYRDFYSMVAQHLRKRLRFIALPIGWFKAMVPIYNLFSKNKITSDNIKGLQTVPQPDEEIKRRSTFGFQLQSLADCLNDWQR